MLHSRPKYVQLSNVHIVQILFFAGANPTLRVPAHQLQDSYSHHLSQAVHPAHQTTQGEKHSEN